MTPAESKRLEESKLLDDMLHAARRIQRHTLTLSEEAYLGDEDVQLIVERLFSILGEAASRLQRHHGKVAELIPAIPEAIKFRNFVIHVYGVINHKKVWEIIRGDIPPIIAAIEAAQR